MEAVGAVKSGKVLPPETIGGLAPGALNQSRESATGAQKAATKGGREESAKLREETRSKIERIAQAMDNYVKSIQRELEIKVDGATGKVIVRVLSRESGEVIREIPPEEMLNLAAKMEEMTGALFNKNV
ncbi:MAG: flagellar protein FlaG [Desulfatiglandales bacterium]